MSLTEILKTVGGSAAIIFAAWIFMGFLQQRYDAAVERYRAVIDEYRSGNASASRCDNIREQVQIYKYRCVLMAYSNLLGLTAAILLLVTVMLGELVVVFPAAAALNYVGAVTTILGLALIIASAAIVIREGTITRRQLDSELLDIPELAESTGMQSGGRSTGGGRPIGASARQH